LDPAARTVIGEDSTVPVNGFNPARGPSLAERTSMKLGGPAEFLGRIQSPAEIPAALDWAQARGLPVTVLGGGSNVVISDAGIPGLVLDLAIGSDEAMRDELAASEPAAVRAEGDHVLVDAGAGVVWDEFVARCVQRGWAGVECLSGIPGRVGATPIQNVGAYGQEVAGSLAAVEVYDMEADRQLTLAHAECGFGYRTSRFKQQDADRFVVLSARFRLLPGGPACLGYPEIARQFSGPEGSRSELQVAPDLPSVRAAVLRTRRAKSMLIDSTDENARSCGSFFLNPELSAGALDALRSRCNMPPPSFPTTDGRFKVPAAWLIEHAGLTRGQRFGQVGISSRHALALVCHTGATARGVVEAAHRVRDTVEARLGVRLEPEPRFLGFGTSPDRLPAL
jgi:UDP-N-acetylmuramate dehydrogenase